MRVAAVLLIAVAWLCWPGCRPDAGRNAPHAKGTPQTQEQGNGTRRATGTTPGVSAPVQRDWGPDEYVKPGSSLESGTRQEIRLNSVTEYRELPNEALWFAGFGSARVDGGSAFFAWNSVTPPPIEIEVANDAGERFRECESLVKAGVPEGKVLTITGRGTFESVAAGPAWLGSFSLSEIEACGLQ